MGVRDEIRRALRSQAVGRLCSPPACSGNTVSRISEVVKPRVFKHYKPLCQRCGWGKDACLSIRSEVPRRVLISEDEAFCQWFEDEKTMRKGWNGYQEDPKERNEPVVFTEATKEEFLKRLNRFEKGKPPGAAIYLLDPKTF